MPPRQNELRKNFEGFSSSPFRQLPPDPVEALEVLAFRRLKEETTTDSQSGSAQVLREDPKTKCTELLGCSPIGKKMEELVHIEYTRRN